MPDNPDRIPLRENPAGQGLLLAAMALMALGVVIVLSACARVGFDGRLGETEARHLRHVAIAVAVLLVGWRIDYRRLQWGRVPAIPLAVLVLSLVLGAMVFVPGVGRSVGGCRRWVRIGGVGFQPSEFVKVSLIVFLAAWLTRREDAARSWGSFLIALLATGQAMALIVTEDFGTAAIIGLTAAGTMLLAGVPLYRLALPAPLAAGGFYAFVMQAPHRWARIAVLSQDPWTSTTPGAYQPRQSLLAIATGGWTGKGLGAGMQKFFLPERSTDFIFSVFCEECGFIGALLLLGLLGLWMWNARRAAVEAPDAFGRTLAGALGLLIALQAVLHIAVDTVIAPPTGISLPFVSYGGSALLALAAAAGLMVAVTSRRFVS